MFFEKKRVHIDDNNSDVLLKSIIYNQAVKQNYTIDKELIILCIGTDRSTGDSLGPLTGTLLKKLPFFNANIIGTVHNPVHASNLKEIIELINTKYNNPFIIAIDAGLGKQSSVGFIDVKKGPLQPGTGVNKKLPEIGDMHITGLVNIGGYMEYLVLQSTRLSIVLKMAETISSALEMAVNTFHKEMSAID
ncbi:spore protease YyaC [Halocella sp. SP3-1]|uniref:spore protease YyaC n=1 Tax=Halocella sp. SP3-1 TaxID=2382161 RepID=UPI000F75151C|nr:spore protease YyaC [Halocella sp. SP3-1]AZO93585.1 spore protease YyaC [Halocella sp. SP3-1]